jgi:hypothetical protein
MNKLFRISILVLTLAPIAAADRKLSLSVYNDNFALIKDVRSMDLQKGVSEFCFTDVAATIEPTSVRFRSMADPDARIVEQNYQFDLVNSSKLLNKYIDKQVEVLTLKGDLVAGKLLRPEADNLIMQTDSGLRIISAKQIAGVKLADLPEGLLTKPTLMWQMYSPKGGAQEIQLDYLARQITWAMNYNAVLSEDEISLDIEGWITLTNNSGTAFPNANIILIAGKPNRGETPTYGVDYFRSLSPLAPTTQRGEETAESFGEYKLYRLPEKTSVNTSEVKQIKLIRARNVAVEKIYLYDGSQVQFLPYQIYNDPGFGRECNKKVNVLLSLENRADKNLGVSLPPGLARIFKRDKDKSLEFVGEDKVPATTVDERVLLYIGDAFDLVGERTQTDFKRISDRIIEESFKIEVKNHKAEPVTIMVIEKMYRGSDWKIVQNSQNYQKLDSRTIRFDVSLKPDETKTVEYRVRYQW